MNPRRRVRDLVLGLPSDLPRKTCWMIAEWAGEASPDGMQHLIGRATWDADAVRDDVREYVVEHLRDDDVVLVVDETGDVKKGTAAAGVQRQYTGAAGRIENSQVAVCLVYAGRRGHTGHRPGPLPGRRTRRSGRLRHQAGAGRPHDRPVPGRRAGWVADDEVYGGNPMLRAALEARGPATCSQWPAPMKRPPPPGSSARTPWPPAPVPPATLVRIAGSRWRVEETFQAGNGLAGLDEHQVRRFTSWSRWVTLAMLAQAFLAAVRADEHARHPAPDGLIPLTCNEIQRLFTALVRPMHDAAHRLGWPAWRRRHQARANASHYRRQAANQP